MNDDDPPRGPSIEAMEREFKQNLSLFTVELFNESVTKNLILKLLAGSRYWLEAWMSDIQTYGLCQPGYCYSSEAMTKRYLYCAVIIDDMNHGLAEKMRGGIVREVLKRHDYSPEACIALERACVAVHQKNKADKGHRNSLKAKFKSLAVKRWEEGRAEYSSKVQFALDFSASLWYEHGFKIDYRSIAEDWLKGH